MSSNLTAVDLLFIPTTRFCHTKLTEPQASPVTETARRTYQAPMQTSCNIKMSSFCTHQARRQTLPQSSVVGSYKRELVRSCADLHCWLGWLDELLTATLLPLVTICPTSSAKCRPSWHWSSVHEFCRMQYNADLSQGHDDRLGRCITTVLNVGLQFRETVGELCRVLSLRVRRGWRIIGNLSTVGKCLGR